MGSWMYSAEELDATTKRKEEVLTMKCNDR